MEELENKIVSSSFSFYRQEMLVLITHEMLYELNEIFRIADSIIRFEMYDELEGTVKIIPMSKKYLDSYQLYLNDEGERIVKDYFDKKNIKLNWNNTRTIFWGY